MASDIATNRNKEKCWPDAFERRKIWMFSLLYVLILFVVVAGIEIRAYYKQILDLKTHHTTWFDVSLVYWSLLSKSLIMMSPVILAGGVFLWKGRLKIATWLLGVNAALFAVWFVADVRLMRITGGHISDYMRHILNPAAWQWGGNDTRIIWQICWDVIGISAFAFVLFVVLRWSLKRVSKRIDPDSKPTRFVAINAVFVLTSVGVFPAISFVNKPLVLERLYAALPAHALFFVPEIVPHGGTAAFTVNSDESFAEVGRALHAASVQALPLDNSIDLSGSNRPNVILIIVESFRNNAVTFESMPKLAAWAQQGTIFKQHYSASNRSDMGTFALLYGRYPISKEVILKAGLPQQASELFRRANYSRSLIASCTFNFDNMGLFMNEANFDSIILNEDKNISWWRRDRSTLESVAETISDSGNRPQFLVSYLMSTHYRYDYPPEYAQHSTSMEAGAQKEDRYIRYSIARKDLINRYRNSLAYLDDELSKMIRSLDPEKNIVIVTGDHGESFFEDGFVTHGTMLSEIQTRVPLVIVGPGFQSQEIETPTSHVDVLPTLVHAITGRDTIIQNCHGHDIFSANYNPQALIFHPHRESWDLIFVRSEGKLKINIRRDQPVIRLVGFADETGRVLPELAHSPDEIPFWQQQVATELKPATNIPKIAEANTTTRR